MSQSVLLNYATFEHDNRPYARLTDEENKLNKLLLADVPVQRDLPADGKQP